ncbi:MAG: hypothetical protein KKF48_00660 [Nanoarchaeota archaeon]|nr:hypothetical protein [Nanoarchaeota archaeon]MBU1027534.1 hypothetical protein [Nanoarchaeota archaeon]
MILENKANSYNPENMIYPRCETFQKGEAFEKDFFTEKISEFEDGGQKITQYTTKLVVCPKTAKECGNIVKRLTIGKSNLHICRSKGYERAPEIFDVRITQKILGNNRKPQKKHQRY